MPHVLRGKEHGVVIKLLEILAGEFLQGSAILGKCFQALIVTPRVRRQVAAAMCRAALEPREKIQSPVLHQGGEGEGGLEWMPDYIVQIAVSLQPSLVYRCSRDLGMYEDQGLQFLCL